MRMTREGLTRRAVLVRLAKSAPVAAGAGIVLADLLSRRGAVSQDAAAAETAERLSALLRTAPKARFWVGTEDAERRCGACHEDGTIDPGLPPKHEGRTVKCLLCAQECMIAEGERGRCRARMNVGGELRSLVYGRPLSIHVDPIEKKPFYHFLPGASAYSLATAGCPLHCKFCQNWEISQALPEDYLTPYREPAQIAAAAGSSKAQVIAYTYNEPTVFTEYLLDIARAARPRGIRSALISCGFMNEAPLDEMCDWLDGIKIDLKGFDEGFYRDVSEARLEPVLRSIKQVARRGVHLEIVNLVVPTLNDSEPMLRQLADWVVTEVGPDVPLHFTRFHPDYKLLNLPPTPIATLEKAREIAMERGIHYAFVGNVPNHPGNHTYCPGCGKVVIKRTGFFVLEQNMKDGTCAACGRKIAGVWS